MNRFKVRGGLEQLWPDLRSWLARGKIGALLVFIAAGQEEPSTFHLQPRLSTGGVKYLHAATPAFSGSGEAKLAHNRWFGSHGRATGQIFVRRLHPPGGEYLQSKHDSDECASASIMPCCGSGASGGTSI
jgi:hypothetical protein